MGTAGSVDSRREGLALAAMLATALVLRILLLPTQAFKADIAFFAKWADGLLRVPFADYYSSGVPDCDYLPGFLYLLAALAWLSTWAGSSVLDPTSFVHWIKPVSVAGDLLLGVALFRLVRPFAGARRSLIVTALVVFNPAVILVWAVWGQIDSLGVALSMMSLAALTAGNPVAAALWAGAAFVVKPQYPLFLAAAGAAYLRTELTELCHAGLAPSLADTARRVALRLLLPLAVLVAVVQALLLPFSVSLWRMGSVTWDLADRVAVAANWDRVTSLTAFNLWAGVLAGIREPDSALGWFSLTYQMWGFLMLGAVLAVCLVVACVKAEDAAVVTWACFLVAFGFFELLTRMHERYLFMAIPLAAAAVSFHRWAIRYYLALSILFLVNVLWTYFDVSSALEFSAAERAAAILPVSLFSAALYLASLAALVWLATASVREKASRRGS